MTIETTSSCGRRHRTATKHHPSKTVAEAKAKFVASVSRGISVLTGECGYSRERAEAALLREIARSDMSAPDDEEIFNVMSTHGLGIEGAASALTVSRALQRETKERNVSILEAIDDLTGKLSVANLVRVETSPVPASPVVAIPRRQAEVRIQPLRPKPTITTTASSSSSSTAPPKKTKLTSKNAKQKHANASRKRPMEDISAANNKINNPEKKAEPASNNSFPTRARSDSLSEVVSAKFGEKTAGDDDTTNSRTSASASVVRAKRGRTDDAEASSQNVMKRSRTAGEL